ncbi:unnamed protein product [Linum trigynum]|uniref:RNase H type-1 domain-containing protein n=1 Tax=Linum trigynum TaxID=586398 RepID=A0AAV2DK89_9ROSI
MVVSAPLVSQTSPVPGSLSCFVDGVVQHGSHGAGGWVIQDASGVLLASAARRYQGLQDPTLVELLALRDAVRWCSDRCWFSVTFMGDAQIVFQKVKAGEVHDALGGALLQEIQALRSSFQHFDCVFVGRNRNRVAHIVARKALSLRPPLLVGFDVVAWLRSL